MPNQQRKTLEKCTRPADCSAVHYKGIFETWCKGLGRNDYRISDNCCLIPSLFGQDSVHFEWRFRRRPARLEVGLHFEHGNNGLNQSLLESTRPSNSEIAKRAGKVVICESHRRGGGWARMSVEKPVTEPYNVVQVWAVETMRTFIDILDPILKEMRETGRN